MVIIGSEPISLDRCFQSRIAQLLQGLLGALGLLPQPLLLDSSASTLAGGAELVQSQLFWRSGGLKLKESHAFIYGGR